MYILDKISSKTALTGKLAPGGGFEPPWPREATSLQVHLKGESPGLLPAWLGDPGNFETVSKEWFAPFL
jgi:hypothetical protein